MIHSSACEYGIRAMCYLADHAGDGRILAREVSENEDIPGPYLGKVFQILVRAGLLNSTKGPGGGFSLARPAEDITLYDITVAIDGGAMLEECAVGLTDCSDAEPCPLHERWRPIRDRIGTYLRTTTLTDMAKATRRKKSLVSKRRK